MAVTIEDILLQRAALDQEQAIDLGTASALGAGTGATIGAIGNKNKRMAGGLVGLILGGGLGAGARQQMVSESPAARMLAKLQTTGTLTRGEQLELEDLLTQTYTQIVG